VFAGLSPEGYPELRFVALNTCQFEPAQQTLARVKQACGLLFSACNPIEGCMKIAGMAASSSSIVIVKV
jgi:hypothetical protein